jgi:hypothetical protein
MQGVQDLLPLGHRQRPRPRAGCWAWRPGRRRRGAVVAIPARAGPPQQAAGAGRAYDRRQPGDGGVHGGAHLVGPLGSAGPVGSLGPCSALLAASLESSAESSPWTSSTLAWRANWSRSRAFSAARRAFSPSSGSAGGRPRRCCNACRAPLSRCLRHSEIREVYRPSRRSSAPLPALSSCSYSPRIRSLVGGRVLPRRPGPLGHLGVGCGVHAVSVCPHLGGGHRRHRSVVVLSRPPLTYFSKASVSREVDTEGGPVRFGGG